MPSPVAPWIGNGRRYSSEWEAGEVTPTPPTPPAAETNQPPVIPTEPEEIE